MATSLSLDLRTGYQEAAPRLETGTRPDLDPARALLSGDRPKRGQALLAVVLAYRAGPKSHWGPVLLDLLAPAILDRLQRLQARPPVIDPEDIRQQFVLEVLAAAASMPLPANPLYLRRALIARANQGVRRKLLRERTSQLAQRPLESLSEVRK